MFQSQTLPLVANNLRLVSYGAKIGDSMRFYLLLIYLIKHQF